MSHCQSAPVIQFWCRVLHLGQKPLPLPFLSPGVWLLSGLLAMPPLLGWGRFTYIASQSVCFCEWKRSLSYTFFMVSVCFCGPSCAMSFCYCRIILVVRRSKKRVAATTEIKPVDRTEQSTYHGSGEATTTNDGPQNVVRPLKMSKRRSKEEMKLTISCLVVVLVFIFCWLPFCIVMFLQVFTTGYPPRAPSIMVVLLGYSNSLYNPIIYGLLNTKFRNGFKRVCSLRCLKNA